MIDWSGVATNTDMEQINAAQAAGNIFLLN